MEKDGSDIVQMAIQSEQAPSSLVRPDLDLVVVAAGNEERLGLVEVDTADWAIMFLESVDKRAHSVVPQLNSRRVEGDEDPWSEANRGVSMRHA